MSEVRTQTMIEYRRWQDQSIAHSHPIGGHQRISFREVFETHILKGRQSRKEQHSETTERSSETCTG